MQALDIATTLTVVRTLGEISARLFEEYHVQGERLSELNRRIESRTGKMVGSRLPVYLYHFAWCGLLRRRKKKTLAEESHVLEEGLYVLSAQRLLADGNFQPAIEVLNKDLGRMIDFRIRVSISLGADKVSLTPEERERMALIDALRESDKAISASSMN